MPAVAELTRPTLDNLRWTYGAAGVSAVLQLGYTAVMGRLLTPADFGLVAMALVFLRFGSYFAEMGVGPALVQRPALTPRVIRAGHTSGIGLGLLFAAVIALAAPLAARLYDTPAVVGVVRLTALTFVINGAGLTATSLLQRDLRFPRLAVIEVVSYCCGYLGVGVLAALAGAGPYSLVAAALGQSVLAAVLAYVAVRHPVAPLVGGGELRALYRFGGQVSIIGFLEFIGGSLDTLVVGRLAGPGPLGQYNRASLLVTLPFQRAIFGLSNVLFATFSRIADQRERIRGAYLGLLRVVAAVLLPVVAGVAVAADEIVAVLLGSQWGPAAAVVPLLALATALDLLSHLAAVVCEATDELRGKLALQAAFVVLLGALLLLATGGSLRAYAGAVVVGQAFRLCGYALLMRRVLGAGAREHLQALAAPALGAAGVAAAIALATAALAELGAPVGAALAAQVGVGALVLALLFVAGPLAPVRREAAGRLLDAGYLAGAAAGGGIVGRMLR